MKAHVNGNGCISCGLCVATCPNVFRMNCDDVAEAYVDVVAAEDEADVQEACDSCPTGVITIK